MKTIALISIMSSVALLSSTAFSAEIGRELVVYSGTGIPDELSNALVDGYVAHIKETYGVDIDVQLMSGPAGVTWATLNTEWPRPSGDVYMLETENVRVGAENGWWMDLREHFTPEEWDRFDKQALESMGTLGTSLPMELSASVLIVQNSVEKGAVTSWDDLGNPAYARRTTIELALAVGSGYNLIAAAALVVGADWNSWFHDGAFDEDAARPTFEKVREWADNALTLTQGSGSIRPLVERGELLVSNWWWHSGVQEMAAGIPVHIVYPKEGLPASVASGPVIVKDTDNPTAAIEWVRYFHSLEAAEIANRIGYVSRIRMQGEAPSPEWEDFTTNANIVWIGGFRTLAQAPEYNQQLLDFYKRVVIEGQ